MGANAPLTGVQGKTGDHLAAIINLLLISPGSLKTEFHLGYSFYLLCAAMWLYAIPTQGPLQLITIWLTKEMKRGQPVPEGAFRNSSCTGQKEQAGKPQLLPGEFRSPPNQLTLSHSIGHSVGKKQDRISLKLLRICFRVLFLGNGVGRTTSVMKAGDKTQAEATTTKKPRAPGFQEPGNAARAAEPAAPNDTTFPLWITTAFPHFKAIYNYRKKKQHRNHNCPKPHPSTSAIAGAQAGAASGAAARMLR